MNQPTNVKDKVFSTTEGSMIDIRNWAALQALYLFNLTDAAKALEVADFLVKVGSLPLPVNPGSSVLFTCNVKNFRQFVRLFYDGDCPIILTKLGKGGLLEPVTSVELKLNNNPAVPKTKVTIQAASITEPCTIEEASEAVGCVIHSIPEYCFTHLLSFLDKLNVEQTLTLLSLVAPKSKVEGQKIKLEYESNKWLYIDFKTREFTSDGTSVDRVMRPTILIGEKGYNAKTAMALVLLNLLGIGVGNFAEFFNNLPNLWVRDPAYGKQASEEFWKEEFQTPAKLKLSTSEIPISYVGMHSSPFFLLQNVKFSPQLIGVALKDGLAVVPDKNAQKELTKGAGANAAGVGRGMFIVLMKDGSTQYVDLQMIWNDVSKPSKLLNRVSQSYHYLVADLPDWSFSSFGNLAVDGIVYRNGGKKASVIVCLTTLNGGSGPAYTRPGYAVEYAVHKSSDEGRVDFLALPQKVRLYLTSKGEEAGFTTSPGVNYLKKLIEEECEKVVASQKLFEFGDDMLVISLPDYTLRVIVHREENQTLQVKDYRITAGRSDIDGQVVGEWFTVRFTVDLVAEDKLLKARLPFFKMVLRPGENISFVNDFGGGELEWPADIMANSETCKSNNFMLTFFVNKFGGGHLDVNTGRLYLNDMAKAVKYLSKEEQQQGYIDVSPVLYDGEYIDGEISFKSKARENAVTRWVLDNVEYRYVKAEMAKCYFEYWSEINKDFLTKKDLVRVVDCGTHYEITEKCLTLKGEVNFEVEISTPRESSGRSGLTVQELSGVSVINYDCAAAMMEMSRRHQESIICLVNMLEGKTRYGAIRCQVTLGEKRIRLAQMLGDLASKTDAQVLDIINEKFPNGLVLKGTSSTSGDVELIVDPLALRSTNTFVSGMADEGPLKGLIALLKYIVSEGLNPGQSSVDGTVYSRLCMSIKAFKTWLNKQIESKALFKRASQTAKFKVTGKVTTGFDPYLEDVDGLPVVVLHPDDQRVRMLCTDPLGEVYEKYKTYYFEPTFDEEGNEDYVERWYLDPLKLEGEVIAHSRTPMIMMGFFRVKLSAEHGYIGYTNVCAHYWTWGNHGDGDGDGDNLVNFGALGMSVEQAKKANQHLLSLAGYRLIFGKDGATGKHGYADFCSEAEARNKKDFTLAKNHVFGWGFTPEQFSKISIAVNGHYKSAVGIAYGIASVCVFDMAELFYGLDKETAELQHLRYATLLSWGVLYEGLGLSGWSAKAADFYALLRMIHLDEVAKDKEGVYTDQKELWVGTPVNPYKEALKLFGAEFELAKLEPGTKIYNEFIDRVLKKLINAEKVRRGFGALANGRAASVRVQKDAELYVKCLIMGALREGSRGTDVGGEYSHSQENQMEEIPNISVHSEVVEHELWKGLNNPWMSEMLKNISTIHHLASGHKEVRRMEEDLGIDY